MEERVYNNDKNLSHKEHKKQKTHSKYLVKKALNNKIAEYKDTYGYKYIYSYINEECFKFIFEGQKVITVYEIDLEEEKEKYDLKILTNQEGFYGRNSRII